METNLVLPEQEINIAKETRKLDAYKAESDRISSLSKLYELNKEEHQRNTVNFHAKEYLIRRCKAPGRITAIFFVPEAIGKFCLLITYAKPY